MPSRGTRKTLNTRTRSPKSRRSSTTRKSTSRICKSRHAAPGFRRQCVSRVWVFSNVEGSAEAEPFFVCILFVQLWSSAGERRTPTHLARLLHFTPDGGHKYFRLDFLQSFSHSNRILPAT